MSLAMWLWMEIEYMDKSIRNEKTPDIGAIVVLANWFQFSAGEPVFQPRVESRMLLWCQKGKGSLTVNGERIEFPAGDWVFLPWKHQLLYEPDGQLPFLVGGIHIIPCHDAGIPVVFQVAHRADSGLADDSNRRDAAWPGLHGVVRGHFEELDRLALLATYILEKFQSATPEEATMRDLARLLTAELRVAGRRTPRDARPVPGAVRRLQNYMRGHLSQRMSVVDLARLADCSVASLHRLFTDYTGMSPARYVAGLRAEKAALLLRTSLLPVHEIAVQVGFSDPFHFSRFFRQKTGFSPRAYQRSRRFFW
jgi:AraC-like DNA-binding protein